MGRRLAQLAGVLAAHSAAMVVLEGMAPEDALWLTLTTATTVGYGDSAAQTLPGRIATVVLLYGMGVFLLAQAGTEWLEQRGRRRERRRMGQEGPQGMQDHLVVIGIPEREGERYVAGLRREAASTKRLGGCAMEVVGRRWEEGLPATLEGLGVGYTAGEPTSAEALRRARVAEARAVLVVAETGAERDDAATRDVVQRVRAMGGKGVLVAAECTTRANRGWLAEAGADVVIRPVRAYPELAIRALCAPGTEIVLEAQMTSEGGRLVRVELEAEATLDWARTTAALAQAGAGVPVGYVDAGGAHPHPGGARTVRAAALLVLEGAADDASEARVRTVVGRGR